MVLQRQYSFCPHLTFRQTWRHKRVVAKRQFSAEMDPVAQLSATERNLGSGEPAEISITKSSNSSSSNSLEFSAKKPVTYCQECVESESRPPNHLWRCLDPKCRKVLCGKQGQNHSNTHYQEYPHHCLQENVSNRRIWCNDCNIEVFPDHRNRRRAPGIWTPSFGIECEPPRGLMNIGNTCFMNAALQCMAAVRPLTSFMLGQSCSLRGKNVASSYLWLLSELWSRDRSSYSKGVMPSRLLHAVRAAHPIFRGFQQHDTQEFLRLFMDTLAEETKVPHFVLQEVDQDKSDSGSDDGTMSLDSETESFETCDSGNASEETMSTDANPNSNDSASKKGGAQKEVKIEMKSIVSEIFDGKIESSAQCLSCKQISSRLEVFQDLSLPIPTRDELMALRAAERYDNEDGKMHPGWIGWIWEWFKSFFWGPSPTLEDCFAAFFSSDELKGKNMYSCEKCQKLRNGVKRCSLYRLPEVLCVHLKRFRMYEYSGGMGFSGKVGQYVQFPLDGLDLEPFLNKDCPNQVSTYKLMGAICHIGSFLGGHYTAYIRRNDEWYHCDDSRITAVPPETVAECEAYVLFYEKSDAYEEIDRKREIFSEWENTENLDGRLTKFHLLSRKWLAQFVWGEEPGPVDNTDVVCPHGYVVPNESVHLGATWIPDAAWKLLISRYGGGPDIVHCEECVICLEAWKKQAKSNPDRERSLRTDYLHN